MWKRTTALLPLACMILLLPCAGYAAPIIDGAMGTAVEWAGFFADEDGVLQTNGFVSPGYGGQKYDVEYLGLYVDATTVYFGLQTGYDPRPGAREFKPGDFGIDINGNGRYEFAVDFAVLADGTITGSLLAVNEDNVIPWEQRDASAANGWVDVRYTQHSVATPWQSVNAVPVGGADLFLAFGAHSGLGNNQDGGASYVVEGSFSRSLLTGYGDGPLAIHWTMECGNDYLDFTTNPVPEPATLILLGSGLLGVSGLSRRKLRER